MIPVSNRNCKLANTEIDMLVFFGSHTRWKNTEKTEPIIIHHSLVIAQSEPKLAASQ